jgi:hypothetical protein
VAAESQPPRDRPVPSPTPPPDAPAPERVRIGTGKSAESAEVKPPAPPGFLVYRRGPDGGYGDPLTPAPLPDRTTTDPTPKPGESWCYVVHAAASVEPMVESAASNEVCVDVKDLVPPSAPTGVALVPRDDGVELSFNPSPELDVTRYRVYRAARGGAPRRVAEIEAPKTVFLDAEAPVGAPLAYSVTAVDQAGNESPPTPPAETTRR